MGGYDWDFGFLLPYWQAFLRGAGVTLALSIGSFVVGTLAGMALGFVARLIPGRWVIFFLNDCVRAIPMLVMLFFVYFFPAKQLLGLPAPGPFVAAFIAISITQAAYTADLVRAAANNVSSNAVMAAQALGLKGFDIWRFVVLPDVSRQIVPAELAFFIGIVRLSSIASVIGCQEVVYVARVASAQNFRSLEAWLLVALIYIVLVVPIASATRRLERSRWVIRRG